MLKKLPYILLFFLCFGIHENIISQSDFKIKKGLIDSVYSSVLNESREFYVEVPKDYNPDNDYKYPVAIILDGEFQFNALQIVHDYYSGGFVPEMVLIGVSNAKNRNRDLTPSKLDKETAPPYLQDTGGADIFLQFIEKELLPYVEEKYPVSTYRTLIGHSYAGLFTVNTLLKRPELFDNYLAIDPSMDWDNQILVRESRDLLSKGDYKNKSLFVSLGGQLHMSNTNITLDNVMKDSTELTLFARSNIEFTEAVKDNKKNGLQLYWKFYPNDLHGTIPLPSVRDGLIDLFSWYQMEHINRFNDPETPKDELSTIIKKRKQKLKEHFGYDEPPYPAYLLNTLGYMSMDMGQPEKAFMYFNFNTEYYPESANSYDSLADYYEAQGDKQKALENVKKAYAISGSDYHKKRIETLSGK
ncbi:esterase [Lutimonas saemankumensis]|uniref:alpha/beta hydrolase-fold protein n=1 Tax=Lutimonas saemankumensis TaxID=483016 RepID=UPI001CD1E7C8|nr:alpha/beta hydrolase-fold protein [Lutimonas saemankumensis]MCA0931874.1 esterase [Lutimonas saemankumensis]